MSALGYSKGHAHELVLVASITAAAALAWWYMIRMAGMMPAMPADGAPFVATVTMWTVMMVAMMLPGAMPSLLSMAALARRRPGTAPLLPYLFAAGYLLAWTGYAVAAAGAQYALDAVSLFSAGSRVESSVLAGGLLVAAGVFQLTPLKDVCLRYCRSPFGLLAAGPLEGVRGTVGLGLRQGLYCIGCCWALMLLMFVFGVMNLAWMALLTLLILVEKLAGGRWHLVRGVGVALVIGGVWLVLA